MKYILIEKSVSYYFRDLKSENGVKIRAISSSLKNLLPELQKGIDEYDAYEDDSYRVVHEWNKPKLKSTDEIIRLTFHIFNRYWRTKSEVIELIILKTSLDFTSETCSLPTCQGVCDNVSFSSQQKLKGIKMVLLKILVWILFVILVNLTFVLTCKFMIDR